MLPARIIVPLVVLSLAGCATTGAAPVVDVASTDFAPSLGVDVATMTRTPSGLYYREVAEGNGPAARRGQKVYVHYVGWLPDGTQIDARVPPADPFEFRVGGRTVIRGLEEGVVGMRSGGQRLLVVPGSLGYGRRSVGAVPPSSVLVFLVELLSVG